MISCFCDSFDFDDLERILAIVSDVTGSSDLLDETNITCFRPEPPGIKKKCLTVHFSINAKFGHCT